MLLPGDLSLSSLEDDLAFQWLGSTDGNERALRSLSAFWSIVQRAASEGVSQLVLLDLGPNLSSINRSGLIAADHVVIPLSPDPVCLHALRSLGPALQDWRAGWSDRTGHKPAMDIQLPAGKIQPIGYVLRRPSVRLDRPVRAYRSWIDRIAADYRAYVLAEMSPTSVTVVDDPHKLAILGRTPTLTSLAQEAGKAVFHLKPADGTFGSHMKSVLDVYREYKALAETIAAKANISAPIFA